MESIKKLHSIAEKGFERPGYTWFPSKYESELLESVADEIEREIEEKYESLSIDDYPEPFNEPNAMHMILGTAADIFLKPKDAVSYMTGETSMFLPLDADGVPIHPGDLLRYEDVIAKSCAVSKTSVYFTGEDFVSRFPQTLHHAKPRTVEDVLKDALDMHYKGACTLDVIDKYAVELQIRGERKDNNDENALP